MTVRLRNENTSSKGETCHTKLTDFTNKRVGKYPNIIIHVCIFLMLRGRNENRIDLKKIFINLK